MAGRTRTRDFAAAKKLEMPVIEMGRALFFQLAKRINEYFNESEAKQ